jgi:hypothetical protein
MMNETAMTNVDCRRAPAARAVSRPVCRLIRHCRLPFDSTFSIHHSTFPPYLALILGAVLLLAPGCGNLVTWGSGQTRRDVYMNVMTPVQQAHYQYLEATDRPISLRLAYLQEIGVYQQWAEQPKEIQAVILRRQVGEGMTPLQVQMSWGLPDERRDETEPAERAAGHAKTVWLYARRAMRAGGESYERSICFLDDRVLWVRITK